MSPPDLLSTYEPPEYTPDELAEACSLHGIPEVAAGCLALKEAASLEQEQRMVEAVLRKVERVIAESRDQTRATLINGGVRFPLLRRLQRIGADRREAMPWVTVPYAEARRIMSETLYGAIRHTTGEAHRRVNRLQGYDDEVALVVECLLDAEGQRHATHGVNRIPRYVDYIQKGLLNPKGRVEFTYRSPGFAQLTGNHTFGQVGAQVAIQYALDRLAQTKQRTITIGGRDLSHAGRLEWMVRRAVRARHAAIAFFNTDGWDRTAPYPDGTESRWGTNPIAIGVPTADGEGIVGDAATTEVAEGWVHLAYVNKLPLPQNILRTPDGKPSIDPKDLYEREPRTLLLPMGGDLAKHKGAMLGQMIELFVHALSGRTHTDTYIPYGNNLFLYAAKVREDSLPFLESHVNRLRSCPTVSRNPARLPGVHGIQSLARAKQSGLEVAEQSWEEVLREHRRLCT